MASEKQGGGENTYRHVYNNGTSQKPTCSISRDVTKWMLFQLVSMAWRFSSTTQYDHLSKLFTGKSGLRSMVGDVHRTLLYGGLFAYPADAKNKDTLLTWAKLLSSTQQSSAVVYTSYITYRIVCMPLPTTLINLKICHVLYVLLPVLLFLVDISGIHSSAAKITKIPVPAR